MQSVILSGAAGGIGRATLHRLVKAGYAVYAGGMCDWEIQELQTVKEKLKAEHIFPVMLDIRDQGQVDAVACQARENHPELFAVVANGGVCPVGIPFEHVDLDTTDDCFQTNVIGNMRLVKACLPMLKVTRGRVILVSSLWGKTVGPLQMSYTISKHGLEAFGQLLRREVWADGIRVSVINPGVVKRTYMTARTYEAAKRTVAAIRGCTPEEISSQTFDVGKNDTLKNPVPVLDPKYLADYEEVFKILVNALPDGNLPLVFSSPEKNAEAIMQAIGKKNPKVSYVVGLDAKIVVALYRLLPTNVFNGLLRKIRA